MTGENTKAHEIKRLTTPLTIKKSKAYDDGGKLLNCVETLSDVRFIIEPKEGILNDNEVLQYAPESKKAAEIRLKRGAGDIYDVLLINESIPWIFAFYYVILLCVSIVVVYGGNKLLMFILLLLFVLPLIYLYRAFNLKRYDQTGVRKQVKTTNTVPKETVQSSVAQESGLESLRKYQKEVDNLKILFEVKESVVRDLIEKRFEPPQITYDKFISLIDSSHKLFYTQKVH